MTQNSDRPCKNPDKSNPGRRARRRRLRDPKAGKLPGKKSEKKKSEPKRGSEFVPPPPAEKE